MLKQWSLVILAVLAGVMLLVGCTPGGLDSLFGTYTVGADGSSVNAAGGNVQLVVPAGAVVAPTVVTVEATSDVPTGLVPGTAYAISAIGVDTLAKPSRLTIKYSVGNTTGLNPASLKLCKKQQVGDQIQWIALADSTLNTTNNTVSGTTTSFGTYAIIGSSL